MRVLQLLLSFVCLSCVSESVSPKASINGVASPFGKWKFESFADNKPFFYDVSLEMKNDTNHIGQFQLNGKAAINFYYASFDIDFTKKTLLFYGIGSTKISGDAAAVDFEKKYYDALVEVERYELSSKGDKLILYLPNETKQYLVFEKM